MLKAHLSAARRTFALGLAVTLCAGAAQAAVTIYEGAAGLVAFNAAAGNPGVAIDFEDLSGDINGATLSGVTINTFGNTAEVVNGADTFTPPGFIGVIDADTNKLFPTSGEKVLSPGGVELAPGPDDRQQDNLELIFATPLSAFGLDILFQSYDAGTFLNYALLDENLGLIVEGTISGNGQAGGAPGGSSFFGFVSDDPSTHVARIIFGDFDNNNVFPDANFGFDTFRFTPAAIPEPSTWAMLILGFGLAGAAMRRRAFSLP